MKSNARFAHANIFQINKFKIVIWQDCFHPLSSPETLLQYKISHWKCVAGLHSQWKQWIDMKTWNLLKGQICKSCFYFDGGMKRLLKFTSPKNWHLFATSIFNANHVIDEVWFLENSTLTSSIFSYAYLTLPNLT